MAPIERHTRRGSSGVRSHPCYLQTRPRRVGIAKRRGHQRRWSRSRSPLASGRMPFPVLRPRTWTNLSRGKAASTVPGSRDLKVARTRPHRGHQVSCLPRAAPSSASNTWLLSKWCLKNTRRAPTNTTSGCRASLSLAPTDRSQWTCMTQRTPARINACEATARLASLATEDQRRRSRCFRRQ